MPNETYFCTKFEIRKTMNKKYLLGIFLMATTLLACDYQKYNSSNQKDVVAGNKYVYGVSPDSAAKQLKNKYAEKMENEERVTKIREKMFSGKEITKGN